MCHPGEIDEEFKAIDPVVETRPQELAFLMGDRCQELVANAGLTPARLRPLAS